MGMIQFTFDPELRDCFIRFGYEIYRDDAKWIPPLRNEIAGQLRPNFSFYQKPGNVHQHFLATMGDKAVGRISAMVNSNLKDRDGTKVGTIGFFECIDDYAVAHDLLQAAIGWLHEEHKLNYIWGPMNFDIWNGYRFMTRGFAEEPFLEEPYNKPYYPEFFERFGFTPKQHWDSIEVKGKEALEHLMAPKKTYYDEFLSRGYQFKNLNMNSFDEEISKLHGVLTNSFGSFLAYTPISVEDFQQLFSTSRHAINPRLFKLVYDHNGSLIGFTGAFLDISEAVRSMHGHDGVIGKLHFMYHRKHVKRILLHLGGYVSEGWRERAGLGRAGFYHMMRGIVDAGYEDVIIALMARGNKLQGMVKESKTAGHREYTLYELRP